MNLEKQGELADLLNQVTQICLSRDFITLNEELAAIYLESAEVEPLRTAFRDALYSILCEREA